MEHDEAGREPTEPARSSDARAQLVDVYCRRVVWLLMLAAGGVWLLWLLRSQGVESGSFGWLVFTCWLGYLYNLYRLSMAVHPERPVAWTIVMLQIPAPVGLAVAISLFWKARSITQSTKRPNPSARAVQAERHAVTRRRHQ